MSGGRRIPIIGDEYVDPEFGTGALKVTPGVWELSVASVGFPVVTPPPNSVVSRVFNPPSLHICLEISMGHFRSALELFQLNPPTMVSPAPSHCGCDGKG